MSELNQQVEMPSTQRMTPSHHGPRVMTMVLEGEIGHEEIASVADMVFRLSMDGVHRLVIDFAGVTHFDFRGVKPLTRHADVFRRLGGDLKLSGLSPYVFAIFRSAGGNDAFDYFGTKDEAVKSFERSAFVQGVA